MAFHGFYFFDYFTIARTQVPQYKSRRILPVNINPTTPLTPLKTSYPSLPMYSIGLPAAIEAFHTADWPSLILIAICILVLILGICKTVATEDYDDHSHEPTVLPSSSFSTIRAFYNRRFDFLQWGFRVTGSSVYQFNLLQVNTLFLDVVHILIAF
jgi:hypothetical protein